jgi:hypothetical protein
LFNQNKKLKAEKYIISNGPIKPSILYSVEIIADIGKLKTKKDIK